MSVCKCHQKIVHIGKRQWKIQHENWKSSWVFCLQCGAFWRTSAKYVDDLQRGNYKRDYVNKEATP